jgi:prolyl oligopeptidase PreP (S9A serine peptidase family)
MQKFIGGALALIILASCGKQDAGKPETAYDFSKDAYIWLEDVEGEEALAWVEEQNAVSLGHLEALPVFAPLKERNLEIYNSDERIATPAGQHPRPLAAHAARRLHRGERGMGARARYRSAGRR